MTNARNIPLDIFRGLVVLNMMFVDAPPDLANIYGFFKHSPWEGITFADLAFPGFVFAMGASLAFSLNGKNKKWLKTKIWFKKLLKRTLILFFMGVAFNACPQLINFFIVQSTDLSVFFYETLNHLRILGVLQRLALVYFVASVIIRFLNGKYIISTTFLLLIISSFLFHVYSPNSPFLQEHNLSIFIDLYFLGENHILYNDPLYEPEGFYGVIASVASMLLGFKTAKFLIYENYRAMIFLGGGVIFIGGVWSIFDIISKPLWTSPYALLTAGYNIFLLFIIAFLYKKFQRVHKIFYPILGFGRNPIFFYIATNFFLILLFTIKVSKEISLYVCLYQITVKDFVSPAFSSSLFAICWCMLWFPLAYYFYKKDILIKI